MKKKKNQIFISHAITFKDKLRIIAICGMLFLVFTGLNLPPSAPVNSTGYDLTSPDRYLILPPILHEISGIVSIDSSSIASVQDENGILFVYDIRKNQIKRQVLFAANGDYEGIARVNNTLYILRSDGTLFEISDYRSKTLKVSEFRTGIPSAESEGLCYDSRNNRLLIACKTDIRTENLKDRRAVYSFNLKTKQLVPDPVLVMDPGVFTKYVIDNKLLPPGKKDIDDEFEVKLRISGMGIHPVSGKLFILSATDFMLCVVNREGKPENISYLNRKLFNQAEGITFLSNGDMLISNEGGNDEATLLRFNFRP